MMAPNTVTVVIVDDHPLARTGVRRMLDTADDLHVVAEAGSVEDALVEIGKVNVQVVVLDISMPGTSGMNLLRILKRTRPEIAVLMLSTYAEETYAIRALKSGASGYLTKDAPIASLIAAVRKAALGGRHFSTSFNERLVQQVQNGAVSGHHELSLREFDVMLRLAVGESVTSIGLAMFLSPKTISTYRSRILEKLNIHNNAELTRYAIEEGLIPTDGPWTG
ncbi:DNA-binding response regulator [Massilia eurypsychrophila]|jgi:DNA-binding NarL/FixJ family response regulator|uniref:DNA-binding response regulator n=1 Tax=Massilia eurypsychrophila TaxID=1485217 RepID=A0A2G8T9W3_9BURK|nr:response regulator transcription factor [Massilia eurypsychrophila]PIL42802.1 DNA-binding response regulator [Massilia eurypsychrophila]